MKPTVKEQLMTERDKLLREAEAMRNEVKGLNTAIELLRDEEDRAKANAK